MAHAARLIVECDPHEHYILSLNPRHPLNFVFDKFIRDYGVRVIYDDWPVGRHGHMFEEFERRRKTRVVDGVAFDTYKELYRRVDGANRQGVLCGKERGLGRRNIFEYYVFGQETVPEVCENGASFGADSLGFVRGELVPEDCVFVAPHAVSQTNEVFTLDFWALVISRLVALGLRVTVNTPDTGRFGTHPRIAYTYHHGDLPGMFAEVSRQRLVLCGNTGIGWVAAAHGVPMIAGEPSFFWFMDYRYRECGVRSVVDIFSLADVGHLEELVIRHLNRVRAPEKKRVLVCIPVHRGLAAQIQQKSRDAAFAMVEGNPDLELVFIFDYRTEPTLPSDRSYEKLCRVNNNLLQLVATTNQFDYLLWIDADIVSYPPDMPSKLIQANPTGVSAPMVLVEDSDRFYDWLGFILYSARDSHPGELGPFAGRNLSHSPPYWPQAPAGDVVEMDCVGAVTLVPAHLFEAVRYRTFVEFAGHMAICDAVKKSGGKVCVVRSLVAYHAELPRYGHVWRDGTPKAWE
jgi:hypothetical protein